MSTRDERQARYAAEEERNRRYFHGELAELFDRRNDGVAAKQRFDDMLGWYAVMFANGSRCVVLAPLMQAERGLQRPRGLQEPVAVTTT